jgi:hypothetical protein
MTKSLIAVAVATLATAGCQTWGPEWSELSGSRQFNLTTLNLKPAIIESIDGQSAYAAYPIKLEPGTHQVTIQGPYRQRGGGLLDTITINMEPCKRYYVNAQFVNRVRPTFEPVVDHVEDVAGCGSSSPVVAAK